MRGKLPVVIKSSQHYHSSSDVLVQSKQEVVSFVFKCCYGEVTSCLSRGPAAILLKLVFIPVSRTC